MVSHGVVRRVALISYLNSARGLDFRKLGTKTVKSFDKFAIRLRI